AAVRAGEWAVGADVARLPGRRRRRIGAGEGVVEDRRRRSADRLDDLEFVEGDAVVRGVTGVSAGHVPGLDRVVIDIGRGQRAGGGLDTVLLHRTAGHAASDYRRVVLPGDGDVDGLGVERAVLVG